MNQPEPEYQIRSRPGGLYELLRDGALLGAWTVKSQAYDALVLHALLEVPSR